MDMHHTTNALLLLLLAILCGLTVSVHGQGCVFQCNVPVAGWGQKSLVFDPIRQLPTTVVTTSDAYDQWLSFTIEAWIFLTDVPLPQSTERPILFKGYNNPDGETGDENNGLPFTAEFVLSINQNGNLQFRMGGGPTLAYGFNLEYREPDYSPMPTNQWIHVAVSVDYQSRAANMYINGGFVARQFWQLTTTDGPYRERFSVQDPVIPRVMSGRVQIGYYRLLFAEMTRFLGRIDDVRIWNRVVPNDELSQSRLQALRGDEAGLLAYHSLNEGVGSVSTSPWPANGIGRIAPANVPTVFLTIAPETSPVWSSSEIQIAHPTISFGKVGQKSDAPVPLFLYAYVPDDSVSPSNLNYEIVQFPTNGRLFWNGAQVTPTTVIAPIVNNTRVEHPIINYVPNAGFTGPDIFSYVATRPHLRSDEVLVRLQGACRWLDDCGICEGNNQTKDDCGVCFGGNKDKDACGRCFGRNESCAGCDGIANSGKLYDDCHVCDGHNRAKDACGVCFGGNRSRDDCGVCFGNNTAKDACGICFGGNRSKDDCGICFGNNTAKDACGECFGGNRSKDSCGICFGQNRDKDDCGVCFGGNRDKDECGVCNGNNTAKDDCGVCFGQNKDKDDCHVCFGRNKAKDPCGVCFGNGSSCAGCDGIPNSGWIIDPCKACVPPSEYGKSCAGCDGIPNSGKVLDVCGVCNGNASSCRSGCDNMPKSTKTFDECGVCGGDGRSCTGCDGVPRRDPKERAVFDVCGVCKGNGSTCADCDGVPFGPNVPVCGDCSAPNDTWCLDCSGCPFGTKKVDACGKCDGNNSTCKGCDGVPNSGKVVDLCGDCGGNGSRCSNDWCDPNIPNSKKDECGVCGGDNSACKCVRYRNVHVAEMDCVLLEYTLNHTLAAISELLSILRETKDNIPNPEQQSDMDWYNRIVGDEIRELNVFITDCAEPYCHVLSELFATIHSYTMQSASPPTRQLLDARDFTSEHMLLLA